MKNHTQPWSAIASLLLLLPACHDDPDDHDDGSAESSPDQVGAICEVPTDCYPDIDPAELQGEAQCLDRVRGGYCTHECIEDEDCCAVEGECRTELLQVCSPFESAETKMCFLSCEDAEVEAAGAPDEQSYCQHEASTDFICRSSGGGSENRKVCVPGDCGVGAGCGEAADCDPDLDCIDDFDGGYCGRWGCELNADCPQDSLCVALGDESYCLSACDNDGMCGFCRDEDVAASCSADVTFVEDGTTGSVCVPPSG